MTTALMNGHAIGQNDQRRAMRSPGGFDNPALGMIAKRNIAMMVALGLGLALGSCSPFSGYVADRWPRWAGGMPDDVPPRPGAPGYDEFIAHGQAEQEKDAAKPAATGVTPTFSTNKAADTKTANTKSAYTKTAARPTAAVPAARAAPAAPVPEAAAPVDTPAAEDPSVVKGGLY